MKSIFKYLVFACIVTLSYSCKKGFLDVKPSKSLLIPSTPDDFWALLDNNFVFNNAPGLNTIADGDLFVRDAGYNAWFTDEERKSYTWAQDIFGVNTEGDWNIPYQQVFYANVVLDGAAKLSDDNSTSAVRNAITGTALFHRGYAYFNLAQEFAPIYHAATAGSLPGLPIRTKSDIVQSTGRGTLDKLYAQIIADLKAARNLLPVTVAYKSRPNLAADYAMLAKTYLVMEDYVQAGKYADSALQQYGTLINYNTLSTTSTRPFPKVLPYGNDEVIFYAASVSYSFQSSTSPAVADPALYASYAANDLRKVIFFRALSPGFKFKGNYSGVLSQFLGIATDELLLIRAECAARNGNAAAAMADLNTLLVKRWKTGTYVNLSAATADAALALVLTERRKELVQRGTRWADLRRLNGDSRFATTLTRTVLGTTYTLTPDSKRYVFPIPQDELILNNLVQNDR